MGTLSQMRQAAQVALEKYKAFANDNLRDATTGRWIAMTMEQRIEILKDMPGAIYSLPDEIRSGKISFYGVFPEWWNDRTMNADKYKLTEDWLVKNRLQYIIYVAYLKAVIRMHEGIGSNYGRVTNVVNMNYSDSIDMCHYESTPINESTTYLRLIAFAAAVVTKIDLKEAAAAYNIELRDVRGNLKDYKTRVEGSAIDKLFNAKPVLDAHERADIRVEVNVLAQQLKNGLSSRTWGFEIEVPDAKGIEAAAGIEKGEDGSLRTENSDGCECDCDDCTYHECNCDVCEYGSSDPEHCNDSYCSSNADMAEFRTTGGIQRVKHAGMLKLCKDLLDADAEMNDSAGTHIHVYAQDLTTHQVGQVLASYSWLENIISEVARRKDVNYARSIPASSVGKALRKRNPVLVPVKAQAVNVSWLTSGERGTIEFRQMNCNLQGDRITFWAWLCRGFVETAKRGAKFSEFKNVTNMQGIVDVFAKYDFTLESENPDIVIPGSRTDRDMFQRQLHKVG
jgi:hypothetical protein